MKKKIPSEVLEWFREQGRKGGLIGGKRSLETMSPAARRARAKKAGLAAARKRAKTKAKLQ